MATTSRVSRAKQNVVNERKDFVDSVVIETPGRVTERPPATRHALASPQNSGADYGEIRHVEAPDE